LISFAIRKGLKLGTGKEMSGGLGNHQGIKGRTCWSTRENWTASRVEARSFFDEGKIGSEKPVRHQEENNKRVLVKPQTTVERAPCLRERSPREFGRKPTVVGNEVNGSRQEHLDEREWGGHWGTELLLCLLGSGKRKGAMMDRN